MMAQFSNFAAAQDVVGASDRQQHRRSGALAFTVIRAMIACDDGPQ
jgi:hypothetical protein